MVSIRHVSFSPERLMHGVGSGPVGNGDLNATASAIFYNPNGQIPCFTV
jgi:hypothetical protein